MTYHVCADCDKHIPTGRTHDCAKQRAANRRAQRQRAKFSVPDPGPRSTVQLACPSCESRLSAAIARPVLQQLQRTCSTCTNEWHVTITPRHDPDGTLRFEVNTEPARISCHRCDGKIEPGHEIWLEFDQTTQQYYPPWSFPENGVTGGRFVFGGDCARIEALH